VNGEIMSTSIVMTVICKDQPGIVNSLSEVLRRHDGNWTQSSMSSLAGQFAGILLATVPDDAVSACLVELGELRARGLEVIAHAADQEIAESNAELWSLDLVGHDRPGIVQEITRVLTHLGVNVNELETEVASASMAGGPLFKAKAVLQVPVDVELSQLETELEALANELMVELRRER
jgi:glycine cleavage system regulatory protein